MAARCARARAPDCSIFGSVPTFTCWSAAALAAAIPAGLPLLLGQSYAAAVPIALLWIAPLFIEAAIRMVWGQVLLAQDQRGWLVGFNLVTGAISLAVIAAVVRMDLIVAVAVIVSACRARSAAATS